MKRIAILISVLVALAATTSAQASTPPLTTQADRHPRGRRAACDHATSRVDDRRSQYRRSAMFRIRVWA